MVEYSPYSSTISFNEEKPSEIPLILPISNSSPYQKENQGIFYFYFF